MSIPLKAAPALLGALALALVGCADTSETSAGANSAYVVIWRGNDGVDYTYFSMHPDWRPPAGQAANYILATWDEVRWTAVHIGHTDDIKAFHEGEFRRHEKWPCAVEHGVTEERGRNGPRVRYLHMHSNTKPEAIRQAEVETLMVEHQAPCNPIY